MLTFCLFVIAIVSYLLGAVNGSIIASKYFFKKDIRELGSGNAGLTNFYRNFGTTGIVVVLLIDIAKTAVAVFLGWALMKIFGHGMVGKLFAGFFVMLGHAFPVYYGFKGGKGVLCGGILVLMLDWRIGLLCWLVFIIAVVFTRYVSLGSICAGIMLPIGTAIFGGWWLQVVLSIMCGLLLVIMHRQNILRLIAGKERKLSLGGKPEAAKERPQKEKPQREPAKFNVFEDVDDEE
ncbi:MAG: glycerol-3-phosphate acyltransferase [Clostridiales bacterium]|nr:glycerol-3-phosphate acyltransferase [Clostridiales bacterium]